jgi:TatD DNase family protein
MSIDGWVDVHTHLDKIETTPEVTISEGQKSGVTRFITIGTEPGDHDVVLNLAKRFFPVVSCTLGVHPHEAGLYSDTVGSYIEQHAVEREVVAVGEIGLDYYYETSPRELQMEAFRRQLDIAAKLKLPVEIHTRDAEADTIEILRGYKGRVTGLLHCFTGTMELAKAALDLGFDISLSGVVTFKNAASLRETAVFVPLDRIHVETDAPFLAPVPLRGKSNTSAYIIHTARVVAELKNISELTLREATSQNARRMFPKLG